MRRALITLATTLTLIAAACGDGAASTTTTTTVVPSTTTAAPTTAPPPTTAATTSTSVASAASEGFPVTVTGGAGDVTVPTRPERIVSLSQTATEMLFAIGAGEQVIAVDSLSNYPAEAPVTDLSAFEPNVEAISEFDPDLVVLSFDPSGDVVPSLQRLGIPALVQLAAATIDDSYLQMGQLGQVTGNVPGADAAIEGMQKDIANIVASLPPVAGPISYYHELDDTYYSAASTTFIGDVYSLLGMTSISDAAADLNFGYPQLSAEFIIEADPNVILLADTKCCAQTAATVSARPGWSGMTAVEQGAIVELDDDIASRWGPRIVELLEVVSTKLIELAGA